MPSWAVAFIERAEEIAGRELEDSEIIKLMADYIGYVDDAHGSLLEQSLDAVGLLERDDDWEDEEEYEEEEEEECDSLTEEQLEEGKEYLLETLTIYAGTTWLSAIDESDREATIDSLIDDIDSFFETDDFYNIAEELINQDCDGEFTENDIMGIFDEIKLDFQAWLESNKQRLIDLEL